MSVDADSAFAFSLFTCFHIFKEVTCPSPETCDLVLCFFYFKDKVTRENYFYNVDFTKERNLNKAIRSRREPASSSSNKHSHVLCQDPCLKYHFGIKWLDYQSNISKISIIKGLDNQAQVSKYVCLIIKALDTQVQKLNHQINQYPPKSLIRTLEREWPETMRTFGICARMFGISAEDGKRIIYRLGSSLLSEHEKMFGSYWR
jgi:hypothetical protein